MGNHLSSSNPLYPDVPLNEPPFPWSSDLGYWDASFGSFSDSTRRKVWLTLAIQTMLANIIIGFVLISIVINPQARKKPFNLFLIFLMIPDLVFNGPDPFLYLFNYRGGKYISVPACKLQGCLLSFGLIGNCQMNALIALEIHRMLCQSHQRRHYFPPSIGTVVKRCGAIYLLATCISVLWSLNFNALSMRTPLVGGGTICAPAPYDLRSVLVYYIFMGSMTLWVPCGICAYVTVDVLRRGLLPKKGEGKRALAIYFFRLLLVFIIFWIPTIVSVFVATNPWLTFVGAIWSHSQGAVGALAMLGKNDVHDCAKDLFSRITCGSVVFSSSTNDRVRSITLFNRSIMVSTRPTVLAMDNFSRGASSNPEDPYLQEETKGNTTESALFENEPRTSETDESPQP
mmetsp:Transcript_11902/g.32997  ORF Transcript_11902/g.32997 Transcript_11902/m.32997 type:complete len:400 (-) Transcript_11902:152-1351(-)|eukprot:CAMPEP_0168722514 /NCGR_PEP_ID=MMETSP0724-20121128/2637_1 /TAXON_ID=265536 /ORGANISM="Amphiprora sp., Strain CCMP467" /LENGTH=399 /DNA_ID=CAMNT_0008769189 /DNA_START=125 /DNA_END=1324 /DNA_ORIENTATION=+